MAYENTPDTGTDPNGADVSSQQPQDGQQNTQTQADPNAQTQPQEGAQGGEDAGKEPGTLLSDDGGDGSGGDAQDKDGKSQDGDGGDQDKDAGKPAPEEYVFEPPEGVEISEDAQTKIDEFKQTAADMGLTKEQFQQLVEFDVNRGQQAQQEMAEAYNTRVQEWGQQVRKDKELGGEKLDENLSAAKRALSAFGSEDLQKMVGAPSEQNPQGLGLGNHPEFLRLMARVGKALGEDSLILGDQKTADTQEVEGLRRMYPSMYKDAG